MTLRRALLVVVGATAVTAVFAGLARLGVAVDVGAARATEHGPLFVVGVFGTLIALERAVALGGHAAMAAPALGGATAIALVVGFTPGAHALAIATGLAFVVVNAAIVRRQSTAFTLLMLLASASFALGTTLWALGQPVPHVVLAWLCFFVLTIVAERLELARLTRTPTWATRAIVALGVGLVVASAGISCAGVVEDARADTVASVIGPRLIGAVFVAVAAWQLRFDVARRTIRGHGLPRFAAVGVLLGAGWLAVSGAVLLVAALPPAGPIYDAVLHAVFVGFTLSMVFAHAPIILPAVARVHVPYHASLYAPLALLHTGLVLRILGDLAGLYAVRVAGAELTGIALALFIAAVVVARASVPRAPAPAVR